MFEEIKNAVLESDENTILHLIKNEDYLANIRKNPWEIIPYLVQRLKATTEKDHPSFYRNLLLTLDIITDNVDADDVILILIKEIEDVQEDNIFLIILKSMENSLLKLLPKNKLNYLAWSLNTVQMYLNEFPIPENYYLEDKEKLLMDADINGARISILYYDMIPFYENLLTAIVSLNYPDHRILLLKSILQLFGHPLLYLDMDATNKPKSKARLVAENLVYKVLELSPDTYRFLDENFCDNHEDIKVKSISLSVFYYLHFAEHIGLEKSLKVYDPIFIFQNTLRFVVDLLTMEHQFVIEKGLKLISSLLDITSSLILPYQLLDSDIHCKFCKSITNIIIYNSMESYRKDSLKIFHDYIYKFDLRGRYLLVYNITKSIDNVSLTSYIITQYKEMLAEQLCKNEEEINYFQGSKLATLLSMFCHLQNGVETDLIKSADQIIAALNFIRYLVLRDRTNVTGFWDQLKQLKSSFLEPLKEGLILSKAHYNLKLKEVTDENARGDKLDSDSKVSVSIEGKHLPELTPSEKIKVINSSITAFDVIDSLLSRLNECIEYSYYSVTKKEIK